MAAPAAVSAQDDGAPSADSATPTAQRKPLAPVSELASWGIVEGDEAATNEGGEDGHGYALGMEYDVETTERTRSDSTTRKSSYRPNAHLELMSMASTHPSNMNSVAYSTTRRRSSSVADMAFAGENSGAQGELTDKAFTVVNRVMDKLTGLDFQDHIKNGTALNISEQIDLLIKQATSHENLSTCFNGWCAFW